MSKPLTTVKQATRKREQADAAYRQAIQAARATGHTLQEIADASGLTRQGVRYLLHPDPRKEQEK
jgi:predicted transcriptional regulator